MKLIVKDLGTTIECIDPQKVIDGDIDEFMVARVGQDEKGRSRGATRSRLSVGVFP
ncbi:MAG: hypothetical protein KF889_11360 [Alphaproteobacteria bacterium]|nr:hypothetical protein [Alphaproteobacteria bacterium]MCW5739412.1 hypothetical protein [Alphaproteobacteria bacterium]